MALNLVTRILRHKDALKILLANAGKTASEAEILIGIKNTRVFYGTTSSFQNLTLSKSTATKPVRFLSAKSQQQEIEDFHSENKVTIIGENVPDPFTDLEKTEFPDYIKDFLNKQGFSKPTVIQSQGWPIALSGKNFVGIAQTGTGKTLAYLLPAVMHVREQKSRKGLGPIVLVLAPTRELARQIEQVANEFQRLLGIRCACIYGGANRTKQAQILERGVDIVIATPGRLNDFIASKVTNLSRCTYVVLDEADRMLDMGFEPQIKQVLEGVPLERQILMFSATWPKEVQHLARDYLGEFVQVNVGSTELTANHNIQQHIHLTEPEQKMEKFQTVMHQISGEGYGKVLVFANTKKFVDRLTLMMQRNGWRAVGIHGDKSQMQRDIIISKFKTGRANILVATDVAARGLDVEGVTHVINYDFPNTTEDYIHRIGRTGRSSKKGESHTILTSDDDRQAKALIEVLKEANQEIPKELEDMARSFSLSKVKDQQNKWNNRSRQPYAPRKYGSWNNNNYNRDNGYNRENSYNRDNGYNRQNREDNYGRNRNYNRDYNNRDRFGDRSSYE